MKVGLLVILLLAGGAFLLVKNGSFSFYAYSVSQDANGRSQVNCYAGCKTDVVQGARVDASGAPSPMVQDALTLLTADQSQRYRHVFGGLLGLLARASHLPRPSGAALVWQKAPAFLRGMDSEESLLFKRVRAIDMQASGSELCRQVALRFVARTQGIVREFANELAQSAPAWATVNHFNTARREAFRSYLSELRPCIAAAPSQDQKELAYTMIRF